MVLRVDDKFLIQTTNGPMRFRHDVIGRRIQELDLTADQAGQLAGFPGNTIKRVLAGKNVTIDTLLRVSCALNIKPEFLLKENFQFRRAVNRASSMNGVDLSGSRSAR